MNAMYYENGSNGKILSRVEKDVYVAQLPLDLIEIGDRTFENNINLNVVQMPDGLEKIGDEAFVHCSFLRDFLIPNSVCKIGKGRVESDILGFYYLVIDDIFIEDEKKVSVKNRLIKTIKEQIKRLDSGNYKSNNPLEYLYENIANLTVTLMDYHPEIEEHIENFGDSATIPPKK